MFMSLRDLAYQISKDDKNDHDKNKYRIIVVIIMLFGKY